MTDSYRSHARRLGLAGVAVLLAGSGGCVGLEGAPGDDPATVSTATQDLVGNADYYLVGLGGKCLDVAWGDPTTGTTVDLFDCNATAAQHWQFDGTTVGGFHALGKCLDVPHSEFVDRNPMWIWDCNGTDAQQFSLFNDPRSWFQTPMEVKPTAATNLCVEVAGGDTDNWTPIQTFTCNNTASQKWYAVSGMQAPTQPPPAPSLHFDTILIRDHRGGQEIDEDVPGVYLADNALFEDGYRWYYNQDDAGWVQFATTGKLAGVGGTMAEVQPMVNSTSYFQYKVVA